MADSGTTLLSGIKTVTTAGTRVQLPTTGTSFAAKTVMIQALGTNEAEIVLGDKEVVAAPGTHATPTQRGIALAAKSVIAIDIIDGTQVWLDSLKNGDGVSYLVLAA